jgi:CRP-like cAMP-binding protein
MRNTKSKSGKRKSKRQGFTKRTVELAKVALAAKIGYLQVEDFPNATIFDNLPTRSFGPHKIIRFRKNELLLVTRGMVEVWHQQQDTKVKELLTGALFGEMPLLGQTMFVTQVIAGNAGASVASINEEQVTQLIKAHPVALARKLYPRLAAAEGDYYRARFQLVVPRLAALLLNLAGEGTIIEGITQRELGEKIGLLRETATVALKEMKAMKLVTIGRMKVNILDRDKLEELSQM